MTSTLDVLAAVAVFGIFNGIGNAIGTYISNKHVIERVEKLIHNGYKRTQKDS